MTSTDLINQWRLRMHRMQLAHYQSARVLEKRRLWLGLPAIALSTLVGIALFAWTKLSIERSMLPWLQISIGLLSVISAVLVGLQTFLRYAELAEKHRMAGVRFANLEHEVELIFTMSPDNEGMLREALAAVEVKWSRLREDSPTIPETIWKELEKMLAPGGHAKRGGPLPGDGQNNKAGAKRPDPHRIMPNDSLKGNVEKNAKPPNWRVKRRNPIHRHPLARFLWCMVGASCAIGLALAVAGPVQTPFLFASLGGTAVFLFGLTRAPAAQPRALFGGHLSSAFIGIACYQVLGDSLGVYVLALVMTLAFMLVTRAIHPPAGANPIIMVYVHAGWSALWNPVLLGVLALVLVAVVWSRLYPGLNHYPVEATAPSPPSLNWGGWGS